MKTQKVVVATRKSELALAQCRQFLARLSAARPELELEELHVVTTGDRIVDRPLAEIGGKGLFLKEIEEALLEERADFAVHSLKDVPPELYPGLRIGIVPEREDARDVLISRRGLTLAELPEGARVGTSSLRRGLALSLLRPDLEIVPIRGNVGTRIQKCLDGQVEATVLARAGINRLGLEHFVTETLSVEQSLPAIGQGALGIELRSADTALLEILAPFEHTETRLCVDAERGVMTAVEGDCKTPVAAHAVRKGDRLVLRALLAPSDPAQAAPRVHVSRAFEAPWPTDAAQAHALGLGFGHELREALGAVVRH
jgi:hydroxymethylbilane synthase